MKKRILIAWGMMCLLLLSSCGDSANQPEIPEQSTTPPAIVEPEPSATAPSEPTPSANPEAERTSEETPAPTQEPTPAPTPVPTPAPTPEPTPTPEPVHQHTYVTSVVQPTRGSEGYTQHTCECGGSYKDNITAKLPAEGKWSDADLATAGTLGLLSEEFGDAPESDVTLGEVIALAARVHGSYHGKLPEGDQAAYLEHAVEKGIIPDGAFADVDRPATRRETAYIFSRAVPTESLAEKNTIAFSAIPDVTVVDRFGEEIYTLYRAGITVGVDKIGTFYPDATLSRGWAATMAVRLLDETAREAITLAEAADLPDTFKRGEERGVTTIYCAYSPLYKEYTSVPLASGLPKLTNEEIDWLIATEDYELIADSISTWADCANYFLRAGFEDKFSNIDIPGLTWSGHICGQQVMARRGGACGGMSNAAAYILRGDYEELGYIHIDHHIQLYLLIDGLYYVMDPAHYLWAEGAHFARGWFVGRCVGATICADSLQKIADNWVASGVVTEHFYTFVSPGDHFPYMMTSETPDIWMFPAGTHVNVWFGPDVLYGTPGDEWTFERDGKPAERFVIEPFNIDWTTGTDWVDESLIKSR